MTLNEPTLGACASALAATVASTVRPTRPDRAFLASLEPAPLPTPARSVTVRSLPQVPQPSPTFAIAEGLLRPVRSRIAMNAFVVEHPEVSFLVDPGICVDVVDRVLTDLPPLLRAAVRPPADVVDIGAALAAADVDRDAFAFALPTHLHWDHVNGLRDLGDLPVRLHAVERAWATSDQPPGVLPALTDRPTEEYVLDGPPVLTFRASHDLLGDGSVVLVDLAGHTPGSVGVLLHTSRGWVLLAGDAAWHHLQVAEIRQKAEFPGRFVDSDRGEAMRTLHRLHAVKDRVRVVPAHDHDAALPLREDGRPRR